MCFIKPLRVIKIKNRKVLLENGVEAICDSNMQKVKKNDTVIVFGNVVIQKV